ncbi:hypothetical protein V492_04603 [Pseudogymnoascus sp. VKM F-4246]|nr:hypothetical protein V492_04603 [Pseudogymnoascus sp. VKM F-4246]
MELEDNDAEKVIRTCSYRRRDFDFITVRTRREVTEPVQSSLQTPFDASPTSGLGDLGCLPEELTTMIIKNLDLLSYFRFRRLNRYARILATEPREYQLVAKYGLEGMRCLFRSRCARICTIVDLSHLLTTPMCSLCGDFGSFLFFLTATRYCYSCLTTSKDIAVMGTTEFARTAQISTAQLSRSFGSTSRTVSGKYCIGKTRDRQSRRPSKLLLAKDAIAAIAPQTVFKENSIGNLLRHQYEREQRFMACTAFPSYDTRTGRMESGVCCKGCQFRFEKTRRGCVRDRDRTFSTAQFLTHFASCAEAQQLWIDSEKGTKDVLDSMFIQYNGYATL